MGVQIPRGFHQGTAQQSGITGVGQRCDCAHRIERTKSSQVTERHTPRCRCKFPREWLTCGASLELDDINSSVTPSKPGDGVKYYWCVTIH